YVASHADFEITVSDETAALLETGGGVRKALPLLGGDPFFVLNSDVIVRDPAGHALRRMYERWRDGEMDVLLLLHPIGIAVGYSGAGDFHLEADGRLRRRAGSET